MQLNIFPQEICKNNYAGFYSASNYRIECNFFL